MKKLIFSVFPLLVLLFFVSNVYGAEWIKYESNPVIPPADGNWSTTQFKAPVII